MVPTYHATLSTIAEEREALLMLKCLIKRKKKFNQYNFGLGNYWFRETEVWSSVAKLIDFVRDKID